MMTRFCLINIVLFIFLTSAVYRAKSQPVFKENPQEYNLSHQSAWEIDVIKYGIAVELIPADRMIKGRTTIAFTGQSTLMEQLAFDLIGLEVDSTFHNAQTIPFLQDVAIVYLNLQSSVLPYDTAEVTIYYHGNPKGGIYFRTSRYGQEVVYSHNEPYDARYWFPCKDDPSDKALLNMQITVPETYLVLSNGALIYDQLHTDQKRTFVWEENYPIATYLISLAAAPYEIIHGRFDYQNIQMPVIYYAYPEDAQQAQEALVWTIQMLEFYSDYIGIYPFIEEKYSMSEVPFREAGAMENQTATTMSENRFTEENVIAHELAHQWWGDAVTPGSFKDIWLNEGFATYFDALFTEHKYGSEAFEIRMLQNASRINTDGSLEFPIYDPPDRYLFGYSVYMKGAWVLHMLRNEVGDGLFQQILAHYFQAYKYKNAVTTDFLKICEEISGKSWESFFEQWLNYGGLPVLHGSWSQQKDQIEIIITQTQPEPLYHFNLELLLEYEDSDTMLIVPFFQKSHQMTLKTTKPLLRIIIDPGYKILNSNNSPVLHIPTTSKLLKSYPNPFNSKVHFSFQLNRVQKISLEIYNLSGQKVATVYQGVGLAGFNELSWMSNDQASGLYFCQLTFEGGRDIIKMMLVK